MPEVGIIISAADKASKVFSTIGENANKGFAIAAKSVVVFNQALELGKKALEAFRKVVVDTVLAAFDFRNANDPAVKQLKEFYRTLELLRARVGDVMIPILQGLADVMGPIIEELTNWINTNRLLIGTKIVEWMQAIGNTAITVVAKAIGVVSKAYFGWAQIITFIKGIAEKQFAAIIKGVGWVIQAHAELASFVSDDFAASIQSAADSVNSLGQTFSDSGNESFAKMQDLLNQQDDFAKSLDEIETKVRNVWGEVGVKMLERLSKAISGGRKKQDEMIDATANQKAAFESLRPSMETYYTNLANLQESTFKQMEAQQAQMQQVTNQTATGMIQAFGAAFAQIITDSENAGKHMLTAILDSIQVAINAYAVMAGAAAMALTAAIPFGLVIAPAVAAAAIGMVKALIGQLPSFDTGGVMNTSSGGAGLFVGHHKERILTANQNKNFERLIEVLDRNSRVVGVMAPAGGGMTMVNNFPSVVPQTSGQMSRSMRDVSKQLNRIKRRGFA